MRCARVGIQIKPIKSASFQKSLRIFFSIFKTYLIQYTLSDKVRPPQLCITGCLNEYTHLDTY